MFSNGTIKSNQSQISQSPLKKNQANPEKYRLPTSKGERVNKPATTSKGVLRETVHTVPKIKNITINTVDDQEPISRRTGSSKGTKTYKILPKTSEPISKRTRSKTFEQNIYNTIPFKGNCHKFTHSYGKLGVGT